MNVGRKDFVSLVLSLLSREVRAGAAAVTGGVLPTACLPCLVQLTRLYNPGPVGWTFPHDYLVEVGVGLLGGTASLHLLQFVLYSHNWREAVATTSSLPSRWSLNHVAL